MKIKAELDDKAYDVAKFVQELGKIQDRYFEELWVECKEKEWIKGVDVADAQQLLFDYCFNGYNTETRDIEDTFSEYVIY